MKKIISAIMLFFVSILLSGTKMAARKSCVVVNPGDKKIQGNWKRIITAQDIAQWANARGLVLKEDAKPYKDNKAGVFQKKGTTLYFKTKKRGFYYLALDLVDFHYKKKFSINSRLEIHIKNSSGREKIIKTISFHQKWQNPVVIAIPYTYSACGHVYITFRESGLESGAWALWDCYFYKSNTCGNH